MNQKTKSSTGKDLVAFFISYSWQEIEFCFKWDGKPLEGREQRNAVIAISNGYLRPFWLLSGHSHGNKSFLSAYLFFEFWEASTSFRGTHSSRQTGCKLSFALFLQ